jgi:hypothetical protein
MRTRPSPLFPAFPFPSSTATMRRALAISLLGASARALPATPKRGLLSPIIDPLNPVLGGVSSVVSGVTSALAPVLGGDALACTYACPATDVLGAALGALSPLSGSGLVACVYEDANVLGACTYSTVSTLCPSRVRR